MSHHFMLIPDPTFNISRITVLNSM